MLCPAFPIRKFLSTLSLRRATCLSIFECWTVLFLSTLSLRRATGCVFFLFGVSLFLSTLSLRRATAREEENSGKKQDFYPRSPCGERLHLTVAAHVGRRISIHALLAESDSYCPYRAYYISISIHALLAESDAVGVIPVILII